MNKPTGKTMSWPALWLTVIIVLIAGYFVGQALQLDHPHHTAATVTSAVTATQ